MPIVNLSHFLIEISDFSGSDDGVNAGLSSYHNDTDHHRLAEH